MKYFKESSKTKSFIIIVVASMLLLVIAIIIGLFQMKEIKNGSTLAVDDRETTNVFEEETLESVMADGIEISTPIGELYYSKVWREHIEIEYSSDDQMFTAVIQATIGDNKADILAIHIGNNASGTMIGSISDSDGNQTNIYLEVCEINEDNGWSQSEIDIAYAMQEGVNQIIEQITQLYGYVPV